MSERSEVKGLWFATAKKYSIENFGTLAVEEIAAQVSEPCAAVVRDPIASEWYPEEMLQEALAGMRRVLAGDDAAAFVKVLEECTLLGVNRFITSLLGLGTPSFLLRRVPVLWTHLRRGSAKIVVEAKEDRAEVHYSNFPYFGDENYVLLTRGALHALVSVCGRKPDVRVLLRGRTHLSVEVTWSAKASLVAPVS